MSDLMNTQEVASYLRIKERKIYDLVRQGGIPCTRVGGKWLFPRDRIDQWLERAGTAPPERRATVAAVAPRVMAGSHDPLLEWCVASSGCGLALLSGGSLDGLERLAAGQASACGIHVLDPATGTYNVPAIERTLAGPRRCRGGMGLAGAGACGRPWQSAGHRIPRRSGGASDTGGDPPARVGRSRPDGSSASQAAIDLSDLSVIGAAGTQRA